MNFLLDRYHNKPIKMSQEQLDFLTLTAQYNKICAEYAKLANESKKDEEVKEEEELSDEYQVNCYIDGASVIAYSNFFAGPCDGMAMECYSCCIDSGKYGSIDFIQNKKVIMEWKKEKNK